MNDDELMTAVRDSFAGVHSATPVERVISRSRAVRARRRVPVVAAGLGAAAAVAVAMSVALPANHPVSEPGPQLAAWAVARQADGSIKITIRELRDPAGLQRTLRADGVPASVTFTGRNPACEGYHLSGQSQEQLLRLLNSVVTGSAAGQYVMIVRPSALPSGAGLQIGALVRDGTGPRSGFQVAAGLVKASQQCTGS